MVYALAEICEPREEGNSHRACIVPGARAGHARLGAPPCVSWCLYLLLIVLVCLCVRTLSVRTQCAVWPRAWGRVLLSTKPANLRSSLYQIANTPYTLESGENREARVCVERARAALCRGADGAEPVCRSRLSRARGSTDLSREPRTRAATYPAGRILSRIPESHTHAEA